MPFCQDFADTKGEDKGQWTAECCCGNPRGYPRRCESATKPDTMARVRRSELSEPHTACGAPAHPAAQDALGSSLTNFGALSALF